MNSEGFPDYLLNGLIPFNSGVADANGCYWYMEGEMTGWDSPDGRVTMVTRIGNGPNADGEYPADQHYRGRTITWSMHASCPSEADREASRYLLAQALDLVDQTGILLVNEEIPKQVVISRSGNNQQGKLVMTDGGFSQKPMSTPGFPTADPDAKGLIYRLDATVEIYAQDPRKYAVTPSTATISGGTCVLDNIGNTTTQNMKVTVNAGITGITGPLNLFVADVVGLQLLVPTVPAGAPALSHFPAELIVDVYAGTIEDSAGDNYYYLRNMRTPWLYLPLGSHDFNVTGGPDIDGSTVEYTPAWI